MFSIGLSVTTFKMRFFTNATTLGGGVACGYQMRLCRTVAMAMIDCCNGQECLAKWTGGYQAMTDRRVDRQVKK